MNPTTQYGIAGICLALIGVIATGVKIFGRLWREHNQTTNRVIDVVERNSGIIQENTCSTEETRKDIARLVDMVMRSQDRKANK